MTDKEQLAPACPNCNVELVKIKDETGGHFESLRDFKILARPVPWRGGIDIWIGATPILSSDKTVVIDHIIWKENPDGLNPGDAPLTINYQAAQRLIDDLWNCGLRPSEGSGSAGALKATQGHLADMRKLVFEKEAK